MFPNTGFVIAIINIGNQLDSAGIRWVGSIGTILLVAMWLFVMGMNVRAVVKRDILWPGKDEDKEE